MGCEPFSFHATVSSRGKLEVGVPASAGLFRLKAGLQPGHRKLTITGATSGWRDNPSRVSACRGCSAGRRRWLATPPAVPLIWSCVACPWRSAGAQGQGDLVGRRIVDRRGDPDRAARACGAPVSAGAMHRAAGEAHLVVGRVLGRGRTECAIEGDHQAGDAPPALHRRHAHDGGTRLHGRGGSRTVGRRSARRRVVGGAGRQRWGACFVDVAGVVVVGRC